MVAGWVAGLHIIICVLHPAAPGELGKKGSHSWRISTVYEVYTMLDV